MSVHGWRPYYLRPRRDEPEALGLRDLQGRELDSKFSPPATCFVPVEHAIPGLDCTCGYDGYRVWPGGEADIIGHVTAIHPTGDDAPPVEDDVILHLNGWRARWYRIDYFVTPAPDPMTNLRTSMMSIAHRLKIPVIPYDHPDGCNVCLDASKDLFLGPGWKEAYRRNVMPAWVKEPEHE